MQNVINSSLEGTGKQMGALQNDVSAGFNGITLRLDTMLKRQDEIIEENPEGN